MVHFIGAGPGAADLIHREDRRLYLSSSHVGSMGGITSFADIAKDGVRYVNRQKGSGTRVLMDYLCDKYDVDRDRIYGYEREEMTHNSVAVQIAGDSADAGMGIYSTAKLYDLDFLPICAEEYDLLIPEQAWETRMVRQLIQTLQSEAFRAVHTYRRKTGAPKRARRSFCPAEWHIRSHILELRSFLFRKL